MENHMGQKIKKKRVEKNLSLRELGEIIEYDASNLSKVERGAYTASNELLMKLSKFYGVSVGYFYGEEVPIPGELQGLGIDEIRIVEEIRSKELSKEDINQVKNFIQFIKQNKKD